MQADFTVASITIEDTLIEVNHFTHDCHCPYPAVALPGTTVDFTVQMGAGGLLPNTEPPEVLAANLFNVRAPGLGGHFW